MAHLSPDTSTSASCRRSLGRRLVAPLRRAVEDRPAIAADPAILPRAPRVVLWDEVILGEVAPALWVAPAAAITVPAKGRPRAAGVALATHAIH